MTTENSLELLEMYSEEIGLTKDSQWTLKELIDSHRHLRSLNLIKNQEYREEMRRGYDLGYQRGMQRASSELVSLETLRRMTLQELANLIGTDD